MSTPAQLAANRENAQKSTGPVTAEGKAKSSLNAVKTGLTARTIVLSPEDAPLYQQHVDRIFKQNAPETDEEKDLTQALADTLWRVRAIPSIESGIYALGRREFAAEFTDEQDLNVRDTLLRAKIFIAYRRDLSNLALQERRLLSQLEKDQAKLDQLKKDRLTAHRSHMNQAIEALTACESKGRTFDPKVLGFVFSKQDVLDEIALRKRQSEMRGHDTSLETADVSALYRAWKERQAA